MQLKLGLIGCGDIGILRAAAVLKSQNCTLAAVSDVDRTRASAASGNSGAEVESEWKVLVKRHDLDAVIVSTPPHLHAEMCIEALRCGKHVLCEKPLARSPHECKSMLEIASNSGRFLATGFNYRFLPSFIQAGEWLKKGAIGTLVHVKSYAGYSARDHNRDWVHDASVTGGGALRDIGIHLIDLSRFFLGEVEEVNGVASNSVWRFQDCEDNGFLLMRAKNGAVGSLHASWTEWKGFRFLIELYGENGCVRASCFPLFAELIQNDGNGSRRARKVHYYAYRNLMEHLRSYRWIIVESLARELDEFVAAIRQQPSMIATGHDGLRAIEIANTPYEKSS